MIPQTLLSLIDDLKKMPGIGTKSAERLALFIATQWDKEDIEALSSHLLLVKNTLKKCPICNVITDDEICPICQSDQRDKDVMMIVADDKDVFLMEKMKTYHGLYHVLGGLIDFSRGKTDQDLAIDTLLKRLEGIEEIIIATNSTVEGEMTAQFIKTLLQDRGIRLSRLAYGLPVGTDLKYADELTLMKAVENRHTY